MHQNSAGPMRISTSRARDRLAQIVARVQDPRSYCVLTRHGKPVAAIVSMPELERIWSQQRVEDFVEEGWRPVTFAVGKGFFESGKTQQEVAEELQQVQMDRAMERAILQKAGLTPIPGGEIETALELGSGDQDTGAELGGPPPRRRWWRWFTGAR